MNRYRPMIFILVLVLGGCMGMSLSDFVPQSPREALVVAEHSFDGAMKQLISLRKDKIIGDEAWVVVQEVSSDIHAALRLARKAVSGNRDAGQYMDAVNEGLHLLRLRIMEVEK